MCVFTCLRFSFEFIVVRLFEVAQERRIKKIKCYESQFGGNNKCSSPCNDGLLTHAFIKIGWEMTDRVMTKETFHLKRLRITTFVHRLGVTMQTITHVIWVLSNKIYLRKNGAHSHFSNDYIIKSNTGHYKSQFFIVTIGIFVGLSRTHPYSISLGLIVDNLPL